MNSQPTEPTSTPATHRWGDPTAEYTGEIDRAAEEASKAIEPEPVAPCDRHEFDRSCAPIVKLAKRICKVNDAEKDRCEEIEEPQSYAPPVGVGTFEVRDAMLANEAAFNWYWPAKGSLATTIEKMDDATLAPRFLGTLKAQARYADDKQEALWDTHPDVCRARTALESQTVHYAYFAELSPLAFRAMIFAAKRAKWLVLRVDGELLFRVEMRRLSAAVANLYGIERMRLHSLRLRWNNAQGTASLCFAWKTGWLNLNFEGVKGYQRPAEMVTFTCDRTVGRDAYWEELPRLGPELPPPDPQLGPELPEHEHSSDNQGLCHVCGIALNPDWQEVKQAQEISAATVAANTNARVASKAKDRPMAKTTTTDTKPTSTTGATYDIAKDLDTYKWNMSTFRPAGVVMVQLSSTDNRSKLGKGRGNTIDEAYGEARKMALAAAGDTF